MGWPVYLEVRLENRQTSPDALTGQRWASKPAIRQRKRTPANRVEASLHASAGMCP
jgi:hypothetical protein